MARYNWDAIRTDHEIHGMSYSQLMDKYGVSKGALSKQANKEGWAKAKGEPIIRRHVNAIKELKESSDESEQLKGSQKLAVHLEVDRRLRLEGIFMSAIEYNQRKATSLIMHKGDNVELHELNMHSQITIRNKDGVFGKVQPIEKEEGQHNIIEALNVIAGKLPD